MSSDNIFKVLSDQQRRDILLMLKDNDMSAGTIAEKLEISPAALSYHLRLLKQAGLIVEYKNKNYVYYQINTSILQELILWVEQFGGKSNEK